MSCVMTLCLNGIKMEGLVDLLFLERVGALAYLALLFLLNFSSKRFFSKDNGTPARTGKFGRAYYASQSLP